MWPCIRADSPLEVKGIIAKLASERDFDANKMLMTILRIWIQDRASRGMRPCIILLGQCHPHRRLVVLDDTSPSQQQQQRQQKFIPYGNGIFRAYDLMNGHPDFWEAVEWISPHHCHDDEQEEEEEEEDEDGALSPSQKAAAVLAASAQTLTTTPPVISTWTSTTASTNIPTLSNSPIGSRPNQPPAAAAAAAVAESAATFLDDIDFETDIKPLLQRAGCVFRPGLYARPGQDTQNNSTAVCGQDFFLDLAGFWKDLCARGLAGPGDDWSATECLLVHQWVRSYIYGVSSLTKIPCCKPLRCGEFWSFLQKIGYKLAKIQPTDRYLPPGVTREDAHLGWSSLEAVRADLLRNGFPSGCQFPNELHKFRVVQDLIAENPIDTL